MQRILNIVAWVGVALVVVAVGLRFAPISPDWSRTGVYLAWAGLAYEDVARATGVPIGTVRSRLHRGRRQLQVALGPREED